MTARTATKRTPVPPMDTLLPAKVEPGTDVARESLATLAAEVSPSVDILLRTRNLRGVAELLHGYGPRAAGVATSEEKAQAQAWLGDPVIAARAATQWMGADVRVDTGDGAERLRRLREKFESATTERSHPVFVASVDVPPAKREVPPVLVVERTPYRRWWGGVR